MNAIIAADATAADFATAILEARRDVHRAEVAGDRTAADAAIQRSYDLDEAADNRGFGYRDGVSLGDLDFQAAAEVYGPDSPVGQAYARQFPTT